MHCEQIPELFWSCICCSAEFVCKMTEYWKSTPKFYCKFCNTWIADNRVASLMCCYLFFLVAISKNGLVHHDHRAARITTKA